MKRIKFDEHTKRKRNLRILPEPKYERRSKEWYLIKY